MHDGGTGRPEQDLLILGAHDGLVDRTQNLEAPVHLLDRDDMAGQIALALADRIGHVVERPAQDREFADRRIGRHPDIAILAGQRAGRSDQIVDRPQHRTAQQPEDQDK